MEFETSAYVTVSVILSDSPFLSINVSLSVFVSNGNALVVSITPMLFSAHSVNQMALSVISKPKICATPQLEFESK